MSHDDTTVEPSQDHDDTKKLDEAIRQGEKLRQKHHELSQGLDALLEQLRNARR
jgi:hypothetical protein